MNLYQKRNLFLLSVFVTKKYFFYKKTYIKDVKSYQWHECQNLPMKSNNVNTCGV